MNYTAHITEFTHSFACISLRFTPRTHKNDLTNVRCIAIVSYLSTQMAYSLSQGTSMNEDIGYKSNCKEIRFVTSEY